MFSVISLDLDDTLWDNKPTLEYAENTLYEWLQVYAPSITAVFSNEDLKLHRTELARKNPHLKHDMTLLRHQSLADIARQNECSDEIPDKAMTVFLKARNNVVLYDDVIPFLETIRADHKIVALSNGNADVNAIGLGDYFSLIISPADVGVAKPDPSMFHAVFEKLNVAPHEVLHIGDEPMTDVLGAQNAGVCNVWINRNNLQFPEHIPQPHCEVSSLEQLLPIKDLFDTHPLTG